MSWKFVASDKFPLIQLMEWKKFYEHDLQLSQQYLAYVQRFTKVPNQKWTLKRAEEDVKISQWNLDKVNQAIEIAKKRGI